MADWASEPVTMLWACAESHTLTGNDTPIPLSPSLCALPNTLFLPHAFKLTPWPVVRKRTVPTERPPLAGEI
jgi:hypothetical protein